MAEMRSCSGQSMWRTNCDLLLEDNRIGSPHSSPFFLMARVWRPGDKNEVRVPRQPLRCDPGALRSHAALEACATGFNSMASYWPFCSPDWEMRVAGPDVFSGRSGKLWQEFGQPLLHHDSLLINGRRSSGRSGDAGDLDGELVGGYAGPVNMAPEDKAAAHAAAAIRNLTTRL
jgi:hypothetical protein